MMGNRRKRFEQLVEELRKIETSNEADLRQSVERLRDILIIALRELLDLDEEVKSAAHYATLPPC